ncbi:hypothetical protein [Brevundimonas sp.]|uniref:hypothetical protein n=1 Tax=Brevundimonas sp. TaxID=1871086 RepID=UPI002616991D|nr:hypothetical protein [Brevundimonas sp.]
MTANRLSVWVFAAVLAGVAAPALACSPLVDASPEAAAERVRNRQAELWDRSDVVFLSEASAFERIELAGGDGFSATLVPALALKGELPPERIAIRHTTFTSCGPIPFLDALSGREGEWFVTYARDLPAGLSIDATIPVANLIDDEGLRAWRKADPG